VNTGQQHFDDRFLLQGDDVVAAHRPMRPPLTDRLVQAAPTPIMISDGRMIIWKTTGSVPETITTLVPLATWLAREFTNAEQP
jgi:hypothetical protein